MCPRTRKNRRLELEESYIDIEKQKLAALERRNDLEVERQKRDQEALEIQRQMLVELARHNDLEERRYDREHGEQGPSIEYLELDTEEN